MGKDLSRIAVLGECGFEIRDILSVKLTQLNYNTLSGITILITVRLYKIAEKSVFLTFIVRNNTNIHKRSLLYLTT
jgi:hypothetical protein